MDMALNELAVAGAGPAPVPAPILAPVAVTIPVALTDWSPSTITEHEAAGVSEVSANLRELVYMPAPAPVPVPMRTPPPTAAPVPVHLAAPTAPMPFACPPQWHGTPSSAATSQRRQLPSSRTPPVDRPMT